jgi:hypothetical protein
MYEYTATWSKHCNWAIISFMSFFFSPADELQHCYVRSELEWLWEKGGGMHVTDSSDRCRQVWRMQTTRSVQMFDILLNRFVENENK